MNYILHLNNFMERAEQDRWLTPHHHYIYMVLFQLWNKLGFTQSFTICRDVIMKKAKIGSKDTYYKCLKDLRDGGYLYYESSRYVRPTITMIPLHTAVPDSGKVVPDSGNNHAPKAGTPAPDSGILQHPVPGNINQTTIKEDLNQRSNARASPDVPSLEEVRQYYLNAKRSAIDAEKFWYHYEAFDWCPGGNPVRNWRALAEKWMRKNFTTAKKNNPYAKNPTSTGRNDELL